MKYILGLMALFLCLPVFGQEKTMTMTWEPSDRADWYEVRRGGCDGDLVHESPETSYVEQIGGDVVYCLTAHNSFGASGPTVRTAWYEAMPPEPVRATRITIVEVQ